MTCPGESSPRPAPREAISETRSTRSPEAHEIPPDPLALDPLSPIPAGSPLVRARPSARLTARPRPVLASGPVPALPSADDVPDRGGAAAAWSAPGVRGARPAAARRALGTESRAGPARRGGGRQVRSSGPPAGPRVRMSARPAGRRGVRDGAGLRRPPSALRADARPAGATAGRAARRAAGRVRPDPRRPAGSVSRRAGGAQPARRRSRGAVRWSASWTTRSGWTGCPRRRSRSSRAVSSPSGSALVFAVREPSEDDELVGLPELVVTGLGHGDARALLETAITGRLDARVHDRIIAETRGNPLALLELPRDLTAAELAGGFALPDAQPLAGRIEQSFVRRLSALPAATRRLLLVAAAEPIGDVSLLWRAADGLGIAADAAAPAESRGSDRVRRPGALSPSARALRGVSGSDERRPTRGPSRAGRGDRPGRRSRPQGVAPRPCRRRAPTRSWRTSSSAPPTGRGRAAGSRPPPRSSPGRSS